MLANSTGKARLPFGTREYHSLKDELKQRSLATASAARLDLTTNSSAVEIMSTQFRAPATISQHFPRF
jgi:hypothetical protein